MDKRRLDNSMTIRNLAKRILLAPVSAVFCNPQATGKIALTFDDGPHPEFTSQISTTLKNAGVRCTFFLVGENMRKYPAIVQQLFQDGHELGSHSMTHPEIRDLRFPCMHDEIDATYQITLSDGTPAIANRYFRPPKGAVSPALVSYCWRHGIQMVFWNRDPEDYKAANSRQILQYFANESLRAGDVVLLHDKTPHTVAALPELLVRIKIMGLQPVTISELLGKNSIGASHAAP